MYGMVASFDIIMQKFYGLQQDKDRTVTPFLVCIEGMMSNIHSKYSSRMTEGDATQLLCQWFYYGLQQPL